MKPDPAADMFLKMAQKDYTTLCKMVDDTEFAEEIFGFHAQQAVEKAAKAMLANQGVSFERTHDLEILFNALYKQGCIKKTNFISLIDLTDFAVQYRYQAFDDMEAELDRAEIAIEVGKFLEHITKSCKRKTNKTTEKRRKD